MSERRDCSPSRKKVGSSLLLNLGVIGICMAIGLFALFQVVITRSFSALEDKEIAAHVARIEDFKHSNLKTIEARSKDWGVWDDTYRYAQDFNSSYEAANLNASSFINAQIDAAAIMQSSTGTVRSHAFDRSTQKPAPTLATALADLVRNGELAEQLHGKEDLQGFVTLSGAPYILGAAKIHRSDGSGVSPGILVFVQRIDSAQASQTLQVPAEISIGGRIAKPGIVKSADRVRITSAITDFAGKPIGSLSLAIRRPLLAVADDLLALSFAGAIILVLAMLAALHWRVRRLVLRPLENLHSHLEAIRRSGELSLLETPTRNDEFGAMQAEFNAMAQELQELRARVESQSFALGKAQSAVGLMHNLRNCLSPVRVILDVLEREVAAPMPAQVPRALAELANALTEQSRREKLVQFVAASLDQQGARAAGNRQSVREAGRNLMCAFAAIDAAQNARAETRFDERCDIASMLSHASNLVKFSDGIPVGIEIHAGLNVLAQGNRVLLSQVIENLVSNALDAVRKSGRVDGAITLETNSDDLAGTCRIVIADNGCGFDTATASRLFERGFSTRTLRQGGLGLHWCANTVKAMRGHLRLESEGPGEGARATIELASWIRSAGEDAVAA